MFSLPDLDIGVIWP